MEEELLLVDPSTRQTGSRSPQVLKQFREHGPGRDPAVADDDLDREIFRHQVETRTSPVQDLAEARDQILTARRWAADAADSAGLAIVASGVLPCGQLPLQVSENDRYHRMLATYGRVARYGATCGMHVHVAVDSDEEGVAVIDRIMPWLPVVVAISANSPFSQGEDTGYASWRSQTWQRWPSAGSYEQFGSAEAYQESTRFILESGAAADRGMLYLDARLSEEYPTVEVRGADVCTDPEDALLLAALTRGLVETAARESAAGRQAARWRSEAVRACHWRAGRFGLTDTLVHPLEREQRPTRDVLAALVDHVHEVLIEAGDVDLVTEGLGRVVAHSGASLQRAAFERTGEAEGVVDDLIERTRRSWDR